MTSKTLATQCTSHLEALSGQRLPWRVVFCTNFLAPYWLPTLRLLTNVVQAFTVLVSTKMEEDRPWKVDWRGVPVILQRSLSMKTSSRHPKGFSQAQIIHFPYDTSLQLCRLRPDVIISMEMGARSVLSALYCAAVPSCRLVIWADVSEITERGRGPVRMWLRRWLVRRAAALVVNGASGRRYVESLGGSGERIHTIPYTTDVELFLRQPALRQPAVRSRLLCVGQLIPRKGIFPFLAACTRWCEQHRSRSLDILIVGDGELWSALESLERPDNMSIELRRSTQYSDMPEVYQLGGVLVLPTLADTWALVVNEAMAAGLPVLGSIYSQAVDDMVVDGLNGWKFRSDDPEDSYRALSVVMDCSDGQLAAMGKAAREASAIIRPELVAGLVTQVIEKVSRSRGAILTNMLSPYRIPVYSAIGRAFDVTVLTSKHEKNRTHWQAPSQIPRSFSTRQSFGFLLTLRKKTRGRTFDVRNLQLPLGVLLDLPRLRPDWIISIEMGVRSLIALMYSCIRGIPLWVWWGGTMVTERHIGFFRKRVRKFMVKHIDHWISYGVSSTEYLNSIGVSPSRILTIQNCAAPLAQSHQPSRSQGQPGKLRLLCVGQLIGRKGIDELIRGLASLQAEGLRCSLTLLGSGPEKINLQRLAAELGVEEIRFAGEVLPEDVGRCYLEADCVVFPTMEDVWGLVVNEAILAGVPVLCSVYAGCVGELVPPEYRFDPCDPESVKHALRSAFRGDIKPIPRSVLRTPESVAQDIIAAIENELAGMRSGERSMVAPV